MGLTERPLAVGAAGAVGLALACSLAACGSSGSDVAKRFAQQGVAKIESQAFAATKALTAVHVAGHAGSGSDSLALDLSLDRGQNCVGSVTVNGQRMQVRRVKGVLYLNASLATWRQTTNLDAARLQKLDGKWVTGLPAQEVSIYEKLCDVANLLSSYPAQAGKDDRVTGTAVAGGQPLVMVTGHFGGTAKPLTINVLATDPHYITRLSGSGADLSLSDFDKPVQVAQPPDANVVHVSEPGATTGQ